MLSKILGFFRAELGDPAVQRGIIVVISMILLKKGLDQVHANDLATAIWSALTIAVSRMPGKEQP